MTSIVITYHDEGLDFLMECINQIRATIDIKDYEIIVVDDCSENPLPYIKGVGVVRNKVNIGNGQSSNVGIQHAIGDTIFLSCCDIRFVNNGWASGLIRDLEEHPKALVCTTCVYLSYEDRDVNARFKAGRASYGANLLFFWDRHSDKRKTEGQNIFEAKWMNQKKEKGKKVKTTYEIPMVLGAFYAFRKDWWEYIDGAWGQIKWGNFDSLISLKSWLFGGECLINPSLYTGHIFKQNKDESGKFIGYHGTRTSQTLHNKALIAELFFDDPERYTSFVDNQQGMKSGIKMLEEKRKEVDEKKKEYKEKTVFSIREYSSKFGIDLREDGEDR